MLAIIGYSSFYMPTKVQPMVYQGQLTTQQAQSQQQPVQTQQFTQPQE